MEWHKELESLYPLPDGSDPSPGYPDYEQILGEITAATKGAKPAFFGPEPAPTYIQSGRAHLQPTTSLDTETQESNDGQISS